MTRTSAFFASFAALAFWSAAALAQTSANGPPLSPQLNFSVKNMSFDLWCQDTQRYAPERCAQRSPADLKAFEDYRSAIERYEIQHLKEVQREYEIRERTNRDPTSTVSGKRDGLPF
jgi:hypothetical protein